MAKDTIIAYSNAKSLDEILRLYERLSIESVWIAEILSTLKSEYNRAYYVRKLAISHSFLNNRREKITERQSLEMANEENKEEIESELEWESLAYRVDAFLKQLNKVLESMRTRISYEKNEKSRTMPYDL